MLEFLESLLGLGEVRVEGPSLRGIVIRAEGIPPEFLSHYVPDRPFTVIGRMTAQVTTFDGQNLRAHTVT